MIFKKCMAEQAERGANRDEKSKLKWMIYIYIYVSLTFLYILIAANWEKITFL